MKPKEPEVIYSKELTVTVIEDEESQGLQLTSWRPKRGYGSFESKDLKTRRAKSAQSSPVACLKSEN
jgi:hypothetical protein